jgi:alpha-glucosidase
LYDLADKELYDRIDEFMLGDGLLIAPMMKEGQTEREVYLPRGNWIDLSTGKCLSGNATVKARANIGQIPVYLNADSEHRTELEAVFASPEWKQITEWQ